LSGNFEKKNLIFSIGKFFVIFREAGKFFVKS